MSELHPPNCMPLELQVAHYIKQVVELHRLNAAFMEELAEAFLREEALRELNDELLHVLCHMQVCMTCAEYDWDRCDGGRKALEAIAKAEKLK